MPGVSVVLPSFERPAYLRAAVDSVLAQDSPDLELLIADDGSGPEVLQYLEEIARRPRVHVLRLVHSGRPAVARNAGIRAARGAWVAFMDSDDLWTPAKLARQCAALERHPARHWSYSAFVNVDATGQPLPQERLRRFQPIEGCVFEPILCGKVSIRTPAVVVSRALLDRAGHFDETLESAEDYDLWLRLALLSEVVLVNQPLVHIRHHDRQHSAAWAAAYQGMDRAFVKLEPLASPAQRRLLRRARALSALRLAEEFAVREQSAQGLRTLAASLRFAYRQPAWWWGAARLAMRAAVPRRVRVRIRGARQAC
jgi:glycosyltransferase involved in cell wall biosynthesis